jgi:hypothetical protein
MAQAILFLGRRWYRFRRGRRVTRYPQPKLTALNDHITRARYILRRS